MVGAVVIGVARQVLSPWWFAAAVPATLLAPAAVGRWVRERV